ncbi:hypothetical protein GUJ93_ZPchr0004g39286 [Zizania palustris]|uniref:Uncharacterized protein n=1 Tax=Zizania palustris TaxID=103762 RepID=A0A8J5SSX8_ZIZPA|nr:hypothetical protein GUJ93_ZPchr0004g39286 [Zizania palustris]
MNPASMACPLRCCPAPAGAAAIRRTCPERIRTGPFDARGERQMDAIWNALVSSVSEPVLRALQEMGRRLAGNLFRCRSFHFGTIVGALFVVAGFCQLCKMTPALFVDILFGYVFYKLSVLAAELQRNGRDLSLWLYFFAIVPEMSDGIKNSRCYWLGVYRTLQTKGGLMKALKHLTIDTFGEGALDYLISRIS